tara:strand:- start:918 stop:1109 length:192 start_codon:yes stop_codon:yes gene_type:complete
MASLNIDGKEYDTDDISENAKRQVVSLNYVRNELQQIEAKKAVFKTAEVAYIKALKDDLEESN